jgi:uncharacterized protein YyaL (SSP411 family)
LPEKKANRLAMEKSPYLLEHASNPVDWYPWGEEAWKRAKNDGKPILLSIGYSTCHWCHVMRRESFEDVKTAELINKNFIPVKVDREELPDVDSYFMSAAQAMTGSGGWPLTVFLTPELEPYYAGTYFPPEPRYGMPSFRQVLEYAAKVWKERRGEAVETAHQVVASLQAENEGRPGELSKGLLKEAFESLASSFDASHGGFGPAPKFPLPLSISFMLRYHYRTGTELALTAATRTLDAMAAGGIRDHVGGGFHRYSTDRAWLVPHFEKMLYDNALLARVFAEAYQATKKEDYARVARETLGWMKGEMEAKAGGFYTAQDADTSEGEGAFYTWTPEEVEQALGKADGEAFCRTYGVTRAGNFEGGRSVLHLSPGQGQAPPVRDDWMKKLYEVRGARPRPLTDTKLVTSWNGLAISAMAFGGAALGEKGCLESANRAADFVLRECHREGRLLRRFAGGEAGIEGTLEDYSFLAQGLLDLFEAGAEPKRLEEAIQITTEMVKGFLDPEGGGFYTSRETRLARTKESYDGPTPSGNSVAAMNLLRISELTGESSHRRMAENAVKCFEGRLEDQPSGHAYMLAVADDLLNGTREVVISAPTLTDAKPMLEAVRSGYHPALSLMTAVRESHERLSEMSTLLERRKPEGKARAYVCEGFTCKLPAATPAELKAQLAAKG